MASNPVPAGYRWIVRDIDAHFVGAGSTADLFVGIGSVLVVVFVATSGAETSFAWRGRQVMVEGEALAFTPGGATANWHINASGYQLTLP